MSEDTEFVEAALVDAAIEAYVDWREEAAEVRLAYRRWTASHTGRAAAFAGYVAALGREERAERRLARVVRLCTEAPPVADRDPGRRGRRWPRRRRRSAR